jgi:hypothetical protein
MIDAVIGPYVPWPTDRDELADVLPRRLADLVAGARHVVVVQRK